MSLPSNLKKKKACLNIKNNDEKCFLWCVLASMHPVDRQDHPKRVAKYQQHERDLNMDGNAYPVKTSDVKKFEKENNISVNIFGVERSRRYFLYK